VRVDLIGSGLRALPADVPAFRQPASIVERDRDIDAQVRGAGWLPLRVGEHEPVAGVAARVAHRAALHRLDRTAVGDVGLFDRS
jgi:hypothetical protein